MGRLLLLSSVLLTGCSMFPYWMRPNQLWKLNAHEPGAGEEQMYFSVPAQPLTSADAATDAADSETPWSVSEPFSR